MIETKVPKDVRSYKTKIIGPFTLRQILCIVAAALLDIFVYFIISTLEIKLNATMVIYGVVLINLPVLAFIIEPQGMPMEKFIQKVLLVNFTKPAKRRVENLLYEDQKKDAMTKKEMKERMRKIGSIGHKHPEFKAFK